MGEVLQETLMMIPDCHRRLVAAHGELSAMLETEAELNVDGEVAEFVAALAQVAEAEEQMKVEWWKTEDHDTALYRTVIIQFWHLHKTLHLSFSLLAFLRFNKIKPVIQLKNCDKKKLESIISRFLLE